MNPRLRGSAWLGAAAFAAALVMARTALTIEVDPGSYQGRTEAAIKEFRAAVALEPNLAHGKELFTVCAECHQADGGGSADGTIPVIAGQHVSVLVKQLVDFRHDRRWLARMQAALKGHDFAGSQELLDVAAYAESLKRPVPRVVGSGDAAVQQEGRRVYYRDCEDCHGRLGEGDLRTLRPRLAGQNYPYLLRQFIETANRQRIGMDDEHVKRIGALSDAEREAVAAYVSLLRPEFTSTK
jgi:cytochrome c553